MNEFIYSLKKHPMNANHVADPSLGPGDIVGTRQASPVGTELPFPQGQQATNEEQTHTRESIWEWYMP